MSQSLRNRDRVLELDRDTEPHHLPPNHVLWHVLMWESTHDPSETLVPWLRINRTTNRRIAMESENHASHEAWATVLNTTLTDTPVLFLSLLAALDQMRWDDDFVPPQRSYSRDDVHFTTQRNMYEERQLNHERPLWSLTYHVIRNTMAGMGLGPPLTLVPDTGNESE